MKHQVKTVALAICDKCHSEVTELVLNSNTCESCYTSKRLTVKKVNAVKIQDTARESYSALITIRCANIEQKIKEWLTLDK